MTGFIAVHRSLWEHEFFAQGEMTEREAWVWMIANAAWKDTRHRVGASMVEVPRGSFMATLRELQKTFKWKSDTRVRNFLAALESEGMIKRTAVGNRNARKTHVAICKYDDFQASERKENAKKTHRKRTENAVKEQGNNKQVPKGTSARGRAKRPDCVSEEIWGDFNRQRKKVFTETALSGFVSQAKQAGWSLSDAFAYATARGWEGFNSDWVEKRQPPKSEQQPTNPADWLKFCEERVRASRQIGNREEIAKWEEAEKMARAKLPALKVVG